MITACGDAGEEYRVLAYDLISILQICCLVPACAEKVSFLYGFSMTDRNSVELFYRRIFTKIPSKYGSFLRLQRSSIGEYPKPQSFE